MLKKTGHSDCRGVDPDCLALMKENGWIIRLRLVKPQQCIDCLLM